MNIVLAVAPHPDDETLGCGGTLLNHIAHGDQVHWLIVTDKRTEHGYSEIEVRRRQREIKEVATSYGFSSSHNLGRHPAKLDTIAMLELVQAVGQVVKEVAPSIVYLPFRSDAHTDHAVVFDAVAANTKWFRDPSIRRVLCYETLSETDFDLNPGGPRFAPNCYVDISKTIDKKIQIARIYEGEIGEFPFPRSIRALRSLAQYRGASCGCEAAESFMILREIIK